MYFARFVPIVSEETFTTLNIIACVAYLVHPVLLNSSVVYLCLLVEDWLTLVGFLRMRLEMCKEVDLKCEGSVGCTHYWLIGTEEVPVK